MPVSTAFDYGPINGTVQAGLGVRRRPRACPTNPSAVLPGIARFQLFKLHCIACFAWRSHSSIPLPVKLNHDPGGPATTHVCRFVAGEPGSLFNLTGWGIA